MMQFDEIMLAGHSNARGGVLSYKSDGGANHTF